MFRLKLNIGCFGLGGEISGHSKRMDLIGLILDISKLGRTSTQTETRRVARFTNII